ncbi:MAG: type II/IV secretion system protein [Candidatus Margulisbacteria bacterium]|nr:type II/IV secretion system protein [Candidatus Margulisiibacteriota bacterium]
MSQKDVSLKSVLLNTGVLSKKSLQPFESLPDDALWPLLWTHYKLSEETTMKKVVTFIGCSFKPLSDLLIDQAFRRSFPLQTLRECRFIPIYEDKSSLSIAVDNPYRKDVQEYFSNQQKSVSMTLVTSTDLNSFLGEGVAKSTADTFLDRLIMEAVNAKCSDIHIMKQKETLGVKFRIHGELIQRESIIDPSQQDQIMSLIKVQSGMDISISNQPQDGRISFESEGQQVDIRVSSIPTLHGEDFVLRLFNTTGISFDLEVLGFSSNILDRLKSLMKLDSGLMLVTGPTGSGKTTTLYALLNYIKSQKNCHVITLEDPVEYGISGVRQSQVSPKIGYTFANGLRSVLRQDPDIIMVGEIRDQETANLAINAAYTGHFVLSTLHTSDCETSLKRLAGFNVDSYLCAQSIRGILSQKLSLKLCPQCREKTSSPNGFSHSFEGKGCEGCDYLGYQGRTVLSELLVVDKQIRDVDSLSSLSQRLEDMPFFKFREDIKSKVEKGEIAYHSGLEGVM